MVNFVFNIWLCFCNPSTQHWLAAFPPPFFPLPTRPLLSFLPLLPRLCKFLAAGVMWWGGRRCDRCKGHTAGDITVAHNKPYSLTCCTEDQRHISLNSYSGFYWRSLQACPTETLPITNQHYSQAHVLVTILWKLLMLQFHKILK